MCFVVKVFNKNKILNRFYDNIQFDMLLDFDVIMYVSCYESTGMTYRFRTFRIILLKFYNSTLAFKKPRCEDLQLLFIQIF